MKSASNKPAISKFFRHTASDSGRPCGPAEMYAKRLHLHEVMCLRNTGNYITEERALGGLDNILLEAQLTGQNGDLVIAKIGNLVNESLFGQ